MPSRHTRTQRSYPWLCLHAAWVQSCSGQTGHREGSAPLCVWWSVPGFVCCGETACWHSRLLLLFPSYLQSAPTPSCLPYGEILWCLLLFPGACCDRKNTQYIYCIYIYTHTHTNRHIDTYQYRLFQWSREWLSLLQKWYFHVWVRVITIFQKNLFLFIFMQWLLQQPMNNREDMVTFSI